MSLLSLLMPACFLFLTCRCGTSVGRWVDARPRLPKGLSHAFIPGIHPSFRRIHRGDPTQGAELAEAEGKLMRRERIVNRLRIMQMIFSLVALATGNPTYRWVARCAQWAMERFRDSE